MLTEEQKNSLEIEISDNVQQLRTYQQLDEAERQITLEWLKRCYLTDICTVVILIEKTKNATLTIKVSRTEDVVSVNASSDKQEEFIYKINPSNISETGFFVWVGKELQDITLPELCYNLEQ